jgi:hypothetical protein
MVNYTKILRLWEAKMPLTPQQRAALKLLEAANRKATGEDQNSGWAVASFVIVGVFVLVLLVLHSLGGR